ncbi:hypothetical protein [Selenihalanaerobacter shriftii]|uniref:Uncharacterized protein n=1 Tax=Selenihalanaerobacter shriftii TaxID=142842 RepID=A0A1T4NTA8_9FIRM|nr:hypothetical protein [Selenihalanaerobacter shriftii]SJZ82385.1 hypothetical protein SAMN02745118_01910 [Selenihalanaerobacter shriftii]
MKESLPLSEAFLEEVLNDEVKKLFKRHIDMKVFMKLLSEYDEMWKLNRLEDDFKNVIQDINLSEEEIEILIDGIIKVILDPDFLNVLEEGVKFIRDNLYTNLSDGAKLFSKKFKEFVKELMKDYPKNKNCIIGLLLKEYKDSSEDLLKDSLEFRSLKGIEEDDDKIAMRQMLKTYGSIVENRYVSYLKLVSNIFYNCKVTKNLDKKSPGTIARKLEKSFENHYSEYKDLVDIWEITIRNSNAHNDFEFKDSNKILIYNAPNGKRKHKKLLTKNQLSTRLSNLVERFIPVGALHVAILDIIIDVFLFGEQNYLHKLIELIKNDLEVQN